MKKHLFVLTALVALLGVNVYALTGLVPVVHATPPTSHTVTRVSGSLAATGFQFTQGDVTDFVSVVVSPEGVQQPTPVSGPEAVVSVSECTQVGENAECVSFFGIVPAPGLQFDTKKLTSVILPDMSVPVFATDEFGNPIGPPVFDVSLVALTWTGVGALATQSSVSHFRIGHTFSEMTRFTGTSREATVSGTISYLAPTLGPITLTGADAVFTVLLTNATMAVIIER